MNTHTRQFSARRTRLRRIATAFSLIEVLIAILILALGLLGLGAVIPVVVREQRVASEATRAVIAANNAKAYLRARPDLNRLVGASATRGGGGGGGLGSSTAPARMGFGVWLEDLNWSKEYLWADTDKLWRPEYRDTGDLRSRGSGISATIPMTDRLWPDPSSGADPLLVWDFTARRVATVDSAPSADETERTLEIAVFVRRIDPAIRVRPGETRLRVLTDKSLPASQRRVALGLDPGRGPTGDGTGDYSVPMTMETAIVPGDRRDRVRLDPNQKSEQWERDMAARPGQRFVDNMGNVYTVLRREADQANTDVVVSPAVPATAQGAQFQQVAFTPQIPAAVEVFRITIPRDPATSPNGAGAGMSPWFGQVGAQP